jgi:Alpha/beta hydrolase domain
MQRMKQAPRPRRTATSVLALSVLARRSAGLAVGAAAVVAVLGASAAQARITRIEVKRVEQPTFQGRSFGAVGAYEKVVGRAFGEVDPSDPHNALIVDIAHAPKNARGMVEYDMDFMILKPVDLAKGNHRLWFEVNNRGNLGAFQQYNDARVADGNNPTSADDAGNGFIMRQGYTFATAGWDASAPSSDGRFTIRVPVAVNADGSPIVGPAMQEFVVDNDRTFAGRLSYAAASLDKSQAMLTVRTRYEDEPATVPADQWEFADKTGNAIRLVPDKTPFAQGTLYTFTYQAKNPQVTGLGFAALRDFNSFLRYAERDDAGTANPLAGDIKYIYTSCRSQPCRTLHDFIWLGFNADEAGRPVMSGMENWIGGSTGIFMNYRFAQPGRTHRQHIARWYPEFQGPFTNEVVHDPITGKTDGRLARCSASNTCPKVFEVNSENEYWSKDMAVGLVDTEGKDRTTEPANVRSYLIASLPHSGAVGPTGRGICQQPRNSLVANAVLRALLVALDEWVSSGKEPPASRVPRVTDGTLVPPLPQDQVGFPAIRGVTYNGRMHTGDLFDFGPQFADGILTVLPPRLVGTPYPALVPKTDADGNDVAGIRIPDVAVPLATYTGWALRAYPAGADDGCDAAGQEIAFAKTKAERVARGDSRPSIEERYPSNADYVSKVGAAAAGLARDRLLLEEDVQAYVKKAQAAPLEK